MKPLHISRIKIHSVLGIDHQEFKAGERITRISGDNGTGKSSIIEAIRGTLSGGNLAKLIRNGEDHGEVVLILNDGTSVTAAIGESKTDRKIKKPDGYSGGSAKEWLTKNVNMSSFNPVEFVEAKPKDRLEQVLAASELELEFGDLAKAAYPMKLGSLFNFKSDGDRVPDPLGAIEIVDKRIRETRTEVNRSIRDKQSHIAELEQSLPAAAPTAGDSPAQIRKQLDAIKQEEHNCRVTYLKAKQESSLAATNKAAEAARVVREEMEAKLRQIEAEKNAAIAAASETERAALAKLAAENQPRIDELNAAIGRAEQAQKAVEATQRTRDAIQRARAAVAEQETESEAYSAAIDKLAKLKIRVMEKLPVPGLAVVGGELYYGQIRVETLNTAKLIDLAIRIAEVTAGPLKFIMMDGFERLRRKMREAFEERTATSDCQFLVTEAVDDQPLTIEAEDREAVGVVGPDEF